MKRVLSMLVVLAMVLSMVPSVFAASETATVLTDISEFDVSLNEDNGYYAEYSWTPAEDGELSLYQYADGKEITITLTQGENTAENYSEVDGVPNYSFAVSMEVVAGEEVIIEVINAVVTEENITINGNFVGKPGKSESNPIALHDMESTVTNSGKLWYQGYFSGTTMTVTGEGDFTVTYNGVDTAAANGVISMDVVTMNPRMPVVFALTGEGEYSITFTYPLGTQMNPEVLFRPAYINVNIPEGNNQGYYYKWTANADGELKLTCPTVEGVSYDVIMTNMSTYAQAWLMDSTDGTITLAVKAGEEVVIQVATMPDDSWQYPALQTALTGEFLFPVGSQMNPEILFRPSYINVNIPEGNNQGYFYKWTANADGELKLTCPTVEGVSYDVIMVNMSTYVQSWLVDSTDGTVTLAVKAGDEVQIQVVAMPDASWNYPAVQTALTGEFIFPIGNQMNPEILFRPNYINVNIAEGNNQGYFYKWTANADGELKLTCPTVEGVSYDVNMTNMSTYAQAWLQDSTDGTITLAVKAGDEVIIQVAAMPDSSWNYPALQTALTGEFIFPVGTQMNPEILFRPAYIPVNIPEGNNQGYFYKWTANADGELKLTCPTVEGVSYDVNMTNMSTYAQAWLQDSTDGTITLAVKAGDEVIIQVAAIPDSSWNYPALQTALTGEFLFPVGSQMNPEVLTALEWTYCSVSQTAGDFDGYFYTYTAAADGMVVLYFTDLPYVVIQEAQYDEDGSEISPEVTQPYDADILVTNTTTYAQYTLSEDGVDNYGMELQIPVKAGEELIINTCLIADAAGERYPAGDYTWCGNFSYPQGSEQNPIIIEWEWNDEYSDATASVSVAAGQTVYFTGNAGMILTINGQVTEMDEAGNFAITNTTDAEVTYALALATPVGAYSNPESIENLPFEDSNSVEADGSYYYIYTVTESGKVVLTVTEGANITVDVLTYVEDSEWPISEQFCLAEPEIDENWNYVGWIVADKLVIDVVAGQELKIQVNGLTDWTTWQTPAVDYTLQIAAEAAAPAITVQPADATAKDGETAQFSVAAEGAVAYRWFYSRDNGTTWYETSMPGYTADTLNVAVIAARNGYQYKCRVTFADGTKVYSEAATLTVDVNFAITAQPADATAEDGETAQFTMAAEGAVAYRWFYSRDNGTTWYETSMPGCTSNTLSVAVIAGRNGYQYKCRVTFADGTKVYTEVATLTVDVNFAITAQPADATAAHGETAKFTVAAEGAVAYRWFYSRDNGTTWYETSMPGYTAETLNVAVITGRDGYQYKCRVTFADGTKVYTEVATLTVE